MWSNLPDSVFRSAASIGILGWMTVALPPAFYAIAVPTGFVFFFWMGEDVHLEIWRRALLAAVAVAVYVTIAIALYAFLEPIGSRQITSRAATWFPCGCCCCYRHTAFDWSRDIARRPCSPPSWS